MRHEPSILQVDGFSVNIVPDWIYNYLTRSGLGGENLMSNLVLDKRMSTEDIATVLYLNSHTNDTLSKVTVPPYLWSHCPDIWNEVTSFKIGDQDELNAKIRVARDLAYVEDTRKQVDTRLSTKVDQNNPLCSETSSSYDFVVTGPKIWLIVKPGFLTMMENPKARLDFYRDYLSTVSKVVSMQSVVALPAYVQYVKEVLAK